MSTAETRRIEWSCAWGRVDSTSTAQGPLIDGRIGPKERQLHDTARMANARISDELHSDERNDYVKQLGEAGKSQFPRCLFDKSILLTYPFNWYHVV